MTKRSVKLTNLERGYNYYGYLVAADRWCNKNCEGRWWHKTNRHYVDGNILERLDITHYVFQKPTDAMAFKLGWS